MVGWEGMGVWEFVLVCVGVFRWVCGHGDVCGYVCVGVDMYVWVYVRVCVGVSMGVDVDVGDV